MTPYSPTIPRKAVKKVKDEIRRIIQDLGVRTYVTKGNIEVELKKKGVTIEGHSQYFSRVIHDGIVEARFGHYKYIAWSNARNGGRSRAYKKVRV